MKDTSQSRYEALRQLKTLDQFVPARAAVAPHTEALRQFDRRTNSWERISYRDLNDRITQWRKAFAKMGFVKGTRIAILLPNGVDAVCCDQAALANATHRSHFMPSIPRAPALLSLRTAKRVF